MEIVLCRLVRIAAAAVGAVLAFFIGGLAFLCQGLYSIASFFL